MKSHIGLDQFISANKDTAGGVPVYKGTRVAIKTLFDYLEESSLDEFLVGFPSVTRLQAETVIELAASTFLSGLAA